MYRILIIIMLTCGLCLSAHADVWKYVDVSGKTHFVDSNMPIYTWVDDSGKRHYADLPGHETAVAVQLVWHSAGSLADLRLGGGKAQETGDITVTAINGLSASYRHTAHRTVTQCIEFS